MFLTGSTGWRLIPQNCRIHHFLTTFAPTPTPKHMHSGKTIKSSWPMLMHPFNILCFYMECWQWTMEMEGTFCSATSPALNLSSQRSYALLARTLKEKWKHRQIQMHPCWMKCSFHSSFSVHICYVVFQGLKDTPLSRNRLYFKLGVIKVISLHRCILDIFIYFRSSQGELT